MSSTFFGLSIGASGLNAFHAAVNTTANNISNVQTEGYSKQVVNLEAASSLRTYQRNGTTGTGVAAKSVTQARDEYYDVKYWNNQSKYGEYDAKYYYMQQIEDYFTDDETVEGFSRLYAKMFNALDSVKNNAGETSVRNEFISDAKEMMTYFNTMSNRLSELQSTVNDEIKSTVGNINSISEKIASLNKQINVIEMEGGHANELRDARALLVDELAEIVPVEINEEKVINTHFSDQYTGATLYTVKLNGRLLVDTFEYKTLGVETRVGQDNQSDVDGCYEIIWNDTGAKIDVNGYSMSGSLKALFQIRDGNNKENLTGTVREADSSHVTIEYPSITDISKMNMPEKGRLTINSSVYEYTGFTFETDDEGNITSYTFELNNAITSKVAQSMAGQRAENGDGVDYKGIPYYQNQMNAFLRSFAKMFNDIEATGSYKAGDTQSIGYDYNGNAIAEQDAATGKWTKTGAFFVAKDVTEDREISFVDEFRGNDDSTLKEHTGTNALSSTMDTYYRLTAGNASIAVAVQKDPKLFATTTTSKNNPDGVDAYDIIDSLKKLQSDIDVYRNCGGDDFLECIYSDVTVDTQQCKVFAENYENIRDTIENQRQSVKGVDEDEEALDLVKFQNAYNLSSKVISVLNEMYDRLITGTGT